MDYISKYKTGEQVDEQLDKANHLNREVLDNITSNKVNTWDGKETVEGAQDKATKALNDAKAYFNGLDIANVKAIDFDNEIKDIDPNIINRLLNEENNSKILKDNIIDINKEIGIFKIEKLEYGGHALLPGVHIDEIFPPSLSYRKERLRGTDTLYVGSNKQIIVNINELYDITVIPFNENKLAIKDIGWLETNAPITLPENTTYLKTYYRRKNDAVLNESDILNIKNSVSIKYINKKEVNNYYEYTNVKMVAHRGLSAMAPENTLPAYEMAGKSGFWGAECDIYETADGEFVLMHDDTLDRMTNGTGRVVDKTLAEIKNLIVDAGANIEKYENLKVPTLSEYLEVCKRWNITPVIEIKVLSNNSAKKLLDEIKKWNLVNKCVVISFNYEALKLLRNLNEEIILQPLLNLNSDSIEKCCALGKNTQIDVPHDQVTKELVDLAHSKGILVNCWTVNDYNRKIQLVDKGIDFITTDFIVHTTNNPECENKLYRIRSKPKTEEIFLNLQETLAQTLPDNTWKYDATKKTTQIKVNTVTKGGLWVQVKDFEFGDILIIEAEVYSISGTFPKIAFDLTINNQFAGAKASVLPQYETGKWITISLPYIVRDEHDGLESTKLDCMCGLWTADVGEFKIRNFKVIHKKI